MSYYTIASQQCNLQIAFIISRTVEVRERFGFASPVEVLQATDIYCSDYYGSLSGWDLGGERANSYFNAWSTNVKLAWNVPLATKTYLLHQD